MLHKPKTMKKTMYGLRTIKNQESSKVKYFKNIKSIYTYLGPLNKEQLKDLEIWASCKKDGVTYSIEQYIY